MLIMSVNTELCNVQNNSEFNLYLKHGFQDFANWSRVAQSNQHFLKSTTTYSFCRFSIILQINVCIKYTETLINYAALTHHSNIPN